MHVSAELARFCPMTALTYNMHSQTTLWTGILADDLDMAPDVRERHERIRSELYRWILEDGALMSQPLSEGIARGATAGVATTATPVAGGFHVSGRKVFASLAGAADAYNFTCRVPGEQGLRFLSVRSDNPGVRIVGDWDPLGMRGTDSRTLVFEDAFVEAEDELLPTGGFDQLAARWPHVYLTLTPTYIGLTRAVVDFVQGYLGSTPPPGVPARRDVPAKQWAWAEIQIAYERSRSLWECAVAEAGLDPTPEQLRRAWAAAYTAMETAPEVAALAIRACGGGSLMRNLPLEQHYRDARCGSVMLPWSAEVCLELLGRFGLYDEPDDHRRV
jgi:alkylation response protein AidB-like acyl-CoA dehydrogenase